jgi:hypothetical protein
MAKFKIIFINGLYKKSQLDSRFQGQFYVKSCNV